jgi:sugar phosphate isomerase/epimerase
MRLTFEVWPNMPFGRVEVAGPAWNSWGDKSLTWCAERIAAYGYDGMDFVYSKLLEVPAHEYDAYIRDIRTTIDCVGISIGYIAAHSTFVSPRSWDREGAIEGLKRAIDAAAALGAPSVCTLIGDGYYDPPLHVLLSRREAWEQCREGLKEVARYARPKGVSVSVELLQGTLINRVEVLERMLDDVGEDNVSVTVDLGTFYTSIKPFMPVPDAIRRLAERIDIVHLKDAVGFPTIEHTTFAWFGGGLVHFGEVADALTDIGFEGCASVEWEGWFAGGGAGVGEPAGVVLTDFDRVAEEAKLFLSEYDIVGRRG